jgi:TonB family protein
VRVDQAIREAEVFERKPVHKLSQRGLAIPELDDIAEFRGSFAGYARTDEKPSGRRLAPIAALIVLLAGGGYFAARTDAGHSVLERTGEVLRAQYTSVAEKLGLKSATATPNDKPENDARVNSASTSSAAEAQPSDVAPVPAPANDSSATNTAAPSGKAANAPAASAVAPSVPIPSPVATAPESVTAAPTTAKQPQQSRNEIAAERPRTNNDDFDDTTVLRVPASAMVGHLITSRVPAYPEAAKADGVEGPVMVEAIITESGVVKHVRVIDGDRRLRTAAEDAVLRWRYRPYTLNGSPIEVSTIIRVDFRLPQ